MSFVMKFTMSVSLNELGTFVRKCVNLLTVVFFRFLKDSSISDLINISVE